MLLSGATPYFLYPSLFRSVTANPRVIHRNLRSSRLDVFDKQHVIALLAVNEVVDEMLCQQKPEATCSKTLSFSNGDVAEEIVVWAVDGGVAKLFEREALTGVFDAARDCTTGAQDRDLHMLAGVEIPTVFYGVQENFFESRNDAFGNVRISNPAKELDQAICGCDVAAGRQANPSGRRRKDFDAVIPTRCCHSSLNHVGELGSLERSREVTEGSLAHGRNDVTRSEFIREDNQTDVRSRTSDFAKKLNTLWVEHIPSGDDQIKRLDRRQSESMLIVNSVLNAPALADQNTRN